MQDNTSLLQVTPQVLDAVARRLDATSRSALACCFAQALYDQCLAAIVQYAEVKQEPKEGDAEVKQEPKAEVKPEPDPYTTEWFVRLSNVEFCKLAECADFFALPCLFEKVTEAIASTLRGKTRDEMIARWDIVPDFTPEEDAKMRRLLPWVFSEVPPIGFTRQAYLADVKEILGEDAAKQVEAAFPV